MNKIQKNIIKIVGKTVAILVAVAPVA